MFSLSVIIAIVFLMAPEISSFASSFASRSRHISSRHVKFSSTPLLMGFFDSAFKNEDLGERQNAGLKNGPTPNENVTINGKKVKAIVGQKVSVVAAGARVKIKYDCQRGDCGTCMVKINGKKQKACQQSIGPRPTK